jgi:PAS domain S-box-containing protein
MGSPENMAQPHPSTLEDPYRSVLQFAGLGIAQISIPERRFLSVNSRLCEIVGRTEAEILRLSVMELTHPDDQTADWSVFHRLMRGDAPFYTVEKRYLNAGGSAVWVRVTVVMVRDVNGNPLHTLSLVEHVGARREAEAALETTQVRLRLITDALPVMISYVGRDERYQFVNRTYEEYFKVARGSLTGKTIREVVGERPYAFLSPYIQKALAGERTSYEAWAPHPEGKRYLSALYVPDLDERQQARGFTVLIEDITEKHLANQRIQDLNAQLEARIQDFETVLAHIPLAVAVAHDPEAKEIRVNKRFAQILGLGSSHDVRLQGDEPQRFRFLRNGVEITPAETPIQLALKTQRPVEDQELDVINVDGREYHLYGSAVPLIGSNGGVRGSVSAYVDMTDRRKAEEALRQSEERLRQLVDTSPVGIVIGHPERGFEYVNESFSRMIGYTRDELRSTDWKTLTPPEHADRDERAVVQILTNGAAVPYEKDVIAKDGRRLPVLVAATLMTEPRNSVVVGFVVDMSEIKQAQLRLKSANDRLRQANEALEQFAYAAAHDLQEPLRVVSLYAQVLEKRFKPELSDEAAHFVSDVGAAAQRARALVADLLEYTRAGGADAHPATADLKDVVGMAVANLQTRIDASGARIECDALPPLPLRQGPFVLLFQNLIGNAIKYSQPGVAPEIVIGARRSGDEWLISVTDNGLGIPAVYQQQIFGVFKRLHGRDVEGTGIGLALSKRIVEQCGGRIWVESEGTNRGSTFYFTVPRG